MDERYSKAAIVLAALYLRGAPRQGHSPVRSWRAIVKSVHRHEGDLGGVSAFLRKEGHWAQALLLESPGLLAWAESIVTEGRVLTAEDPLYPRRWLRELGLAAPPCLHICGVLPEGPYLGAVGCRELSPEDQQVAESLGADVIRTAHSLVSGGAPGADSLAATGALRALKSARSQVRQSVVRILPRGLRDSDVEFGQGQGISLSLLPGGARFSRFAALERNALIYSMTEGTFVVRSRYRRGGTWAGASEALRRRLSPVFIREDLSDAAHRALRSLGALGYEPERGVWAALMSPPAQRPLFAVDDRTAFGASDPPAISPGIIADGEPDCQGWGPSQNTLSILGSSACQWANSSCTSA